jgi:hypothetical protein
VTTATRSDALPDIPTVGEFLPGYEASGWYGIGAPAKWPSHEESPEFRRDHGVGRKAGSLTSFRKKYVIRKVASP